MEGQTKGKHCQESWVLILTSPVNGLRFGGVISAGLGIFISEQSEEALSISLSIPSLPFLFQVEKKDRQQDNWKNNSKANISTTRTSLKHKAESLCRFRWHALRERWWLPSPGTFINKLNINPKHFLSFQKPTLRPELSKQAGIHTLCSEYEPVKLLSRVWLFVTPWTVAYQAPPSMEFSRQDYWNGLPFPSPVQSLTLP